MKNNILSAMTTSFIKEDNESITKLQTKLINNSKNNRMLEVLKEELKNCDEYLMTSAFLTHGGIMSIFQVLSELDNKKIRGQIITGDYLTFTQPKALEQLMKLKNTKVRMLRDENLHTKGYFFRKGNIWTLIIGSSNLTITALTTNMEWNIKLTSLKNGKISKDIIKNFEIMYKQAKSVEEIYDEYKDIYDKEKSKKSMREINSVYNNRIIKPNDIQSEALLALDNMKNSGITKALAISATGTGKTFLSAFAVEAFKAKKVLFIVHRDTIINAAMNTYKIVFGDEKTIGKYNPTNENNYDIVFAMIQTLEKEKNLNNFSSDFFDYIVIDEAHRVGAKSYQKIIKHFNPKFMLGMTATPDRTDGRSIYDIFEHNIACEIRLSEALEKQVLAPFHYYGVTDVQIEGESVEIEKIITEERVKNMVEKSELYGHGGETLKGLIFVSTVEEAKELELKLLPFNIRSKSLTGKNTNVERELAIQNLKEGKLEYLITVDILNEGVDIPEINQIILFRPTQSAIVYIQQIGRGLRKCQGKESLIIIDFIGNYKNEYFIPIAVGQNYTYDKTRLIEQVLNPKLPGICTMDFELIPRSRIIKSIENENFSKLKKIKNDINILIDKYGRIPKLMDFESNELINPVAIMSYSKSYIEIILEHIQKEHELTVRLKISEKEINFYNFIFKEFSESKRIHEMEILKNLLNNKEQTIEKLARIISETTGFKNELNSTENALKQMEKKIFLLSNRKEYIPLIKSSGDIYEINEEFKIYYHKNTSFKILIDDLLEWNIYYYNENYKKENESNFKEFKKYKRIDIFALMNIDYNNIIQTLGSYNSKEDMLFLIKLENGSYPNKILNSREVVVFSTTNRKKNSKVEKKIISEELKTKIFVSIPNTKEYMYLGEVSKCTDAIEMLIEGKSVVKFTFDMKNDIPESILNLFDVLHDEKLK